MNNNASAPQSADAGTPQIWKRNATVFLSSQLISLFGSSLVQFAITLYITQTTQSGVPMTISILCAFLPSLLLSPFAGVWADRYDRKKLIVLADGMIALCTLVMALLFMAGYQALWLLYVVSAIRGLGGAVQSPAISAMLPSIVPQSQLTRINGINGSLQSLLNLASPALAGVMLGFASIEAIFFVDVITAAIAIFVMLRYLKVDTQVRSADMSGPINYLDDMKKGLAYIRQHGFLMHMFMFLVPIFICIAPVAFLTPLQVVRTFGNETWKLSAIEVAFSAGMLAGGLLISTWSGFKNRMRTISVSMICMGLMTLLLGFSISFPVYLLLMALNGMALPLFNTPAIVIMQEKVDPNYLGRVMSVMSIINSSIMPLSMLLFGPLADVLPIEMLLIITGVCMALIGALISMDRVLMRAGEPSANPAAPQPQQG